MAVWVGGFQVAGLVTLCIGAVGFSLSAYGFSRVNPNAQPPIGQRGAAVFGLVSGAVAVLASVAYLLTTHR